MGLVYIAAIYAAYLLIGLGLLVVVLVFAVVFAWFGHESHRVTQQTRLLSELGLMEIHVREREPTGLSLVARRLLGQDDAWARNRLGEGWFWRPRVLVTWTTTDEQVPEVVKRIKRLGVVSELHLEESPVTEQGIATLKNELPDVAVLTRADLINEVNPRPTEHFASVALQHVATVGAGVLGVVIVLVWPVLRWRKNGRTPARARVGGNGTSR